MGDAVHVTYPFNSNGAAQAMKNTAVLFAILAKLQNPEEIPNPFAAHDTVQRPRLQKVEEFAREYRKSFAYDLDGVGDDLYKMKEYFKEAAPFTNDADLQMQNDEAVGIFEREYQQV